MADELCAKTRAPSKFIIACRVMQPELDALSKGVAGVRLIYLDQGLHRTPNKMGPLIQEQIDNLGEQQGVVVLGYGLCSNGIVGVRSRAHELIVARCHDCIALFFGSLKVYKSAFNSRPGTYYLTSGWIAEKKDPLSIVQEDYAPRFGLETSVWVMQEELKNYTHIALIVNGTSENAAIRERALENAAFFNKTYEEIPGSMDYFSKLVHGPYDKSDFFRFPAGQPITQDPFLDGKDE